MFTFLIATHELGHMLAAKAFGVKVKEYSIGMGPAILKKQGKETLYAVRAVPFGGFCAIEGEDGNTNSPRSLAAQAYWKQVIIFLAGVTVNFLTGLLIIFSIYITADAFMTTEIVSISPEATYVGEDGLMVGDMIYAINGERVYVPADVEMISMATGTTSSGIMEVTILRDGEKLTRTLTRSTYTNSAGEEYTGFGFSYGGQEDATLAVKLRNTWYNTIDFVRYVRYNFQILFNGSAGIDDLRGPVGIVSEITNLGVETEEQYGVGAAMEDILYFAAMIAVNLAVMNLLPIPALDGGRVVMLTIDCIALKLFKKKTSQKIANVLTAGTFVLVLGLMVIITFKDVLRLFA
jgi:regulator of sigma E protease